MIEKNYWFSECPERTKSNTLRSISPHCGSQSKFYSPRCSRFGQINFPESACEGFFVKKHLQNYTSSTSSHLHLCTITFSPISLLIFTSAHLHLCSSSHPRIYISAHLHLHTSTSLLMFTSAHLHLCSSSHPHVYISHLHLSLFLTFSLKAGGSATGPPGNATLCGDCACRVREMQARVRFGFGAGNPLRRSCVSRTRNAGENAIWLCRGQPSAKIVRVESAKCRRECDLLAGIARVECAKCRRECDLSRSRATLQGIVRVECAKCRSGTTLCGDRARRVREEMQARVRCVPVAGNPLRGSRASSARNAGESAICPGQGQPSAGIVRVECAKRRRECDLTRSGALRRSCALRARNAGESAFWPGPGQPSALRAQNAGESAS